MAREVKVRPSITVKDCIMIASVLEREITNRISAGQVSSTNVIRMAVLKDYFLSFQSNEDRIEAEVQRRMASLVGNEVPGTDADVAEPVTDASTDPAPPTVTEPVFEQADVSAAISPVDRTDLTDDQIYDLLALRDAKQRTEAENNWFLARGTWIRMAREQKKSTNVEANDL
jgi:hypothetical protein